MSKRGTNTAGIAETVHPSTNDEQTAETATETSDATVSSQSLTLAEIEASGLDPAPYGYKRSET